MLFSLFISCPKGLEYLLEDEVRDIGLNVTQVSPEGVYGKADLAIIYSLCLWSRIANRVQVILFKGNASNKDNLYNTCYEYDWQSQFNCNKTIAVEFHGESLELRNSMFAAQVVKDAIVDKFRKINNERPMVTKDNPNIRIHAHLKRDVITVSLDVTGYSLHARGYKVMTGAATIKENIAAAMLVRAKWPDAILNNQTLYDPFCGTGTIVIEAAMMAANIAPGLYRGDKSFKHWLAHNDTLWNSIRLNAISKIKSPNGSIKLYGSDIDEMAIEAAKQNAASARVSSWIEWRVLDFTKFGDTSNLNIQNGIIVSNPPYGERLGSQTQLIPLYQSVGKVLKDSFKGFKAFILNSDSLLAKAIGLKAFNQYTLYNGPLACKLYCFAINDDNQLKQFNNNSANLTNSDMFANRLKKNYQHLQKWAKRNNISCYRVYDADLPEYAFAIDIYNDYVVLQEYTKPAEIPDNIAQKRYLDVVEIAPIVLNIKPENVVIKHRAKQKGNLQYKKLSSKNDFIQTTEGTVKLNVNLHDYLDTGVFLDHRLLRLKFSELKPGTKFLNCFCYTATASLHAAMSGAITTNVDMSYTYLDWGKSNFKLNSIDTEKHQFIQADCLKWLKTSTDKFDVIFLDPPSFSNSKRMDDTLDIQRDHTSLIETTMQLLKPDGLLYFSTNFRHFKLSPVIQDNYSVQDITKSTIDLDFKRDQKIHQCFLIANLYNNV
jgi:23S rRNA (guanine2445-N2)-methyltransferase / 23S rRNA (guanine2069-N7)-methyltransferase